MLGFCASCGCDDKAVMTAGGVGAGRLCCLRGGVGPCSGTCDWSCQGFSLRLLNRWTLGLGLTAGLICCACWVVTVLGWWYCWLALLDDVVWWWWWWWPVWIAAVLLFIIQWVAVLRVPHSRTPDNSSSAPMWFLLMSFLPIRCFCSFYWLLFFIKTRLRFPFSLIFFLVTWTDSWI